MYFFEVLLQRRNSSCPCEITFKQSRLVKLVPIIFFFLPLNNVYLRTIEFFLKKITNTSFNVVVHRTNSNRCTYRKPARQQQFPFVWLWRKGMKGKMQALSTHQPPVPATLKTTAQHSEPRRFTANSAEGLGNGETRFAYLCCAHCSDSCWDRFQSLLHSQLPTYFYPWHPFQE